MNLTILKALDDEFVKIAKAGKKAETDEPNLNFFERHSKKLLGGGSVGLGAAAVSAHLRNKKRIANADAKRKTDAEMQEQVRKQHIYKNPKVDQQKPAGLTEWDTISNDPHRRAAADKRYAQRLLPEAPRMPDLEPKAKKPNVKAKNRRLSGAPKQRKAHVPNFNVEKVTKKARNAARQFARNAKRGLF